MKCDHRCESILGESPRIFNAAEITVSVNDSTRWVRLVETMSITHFITGAHKCLINAFPNTRAGPFERFLRWQRLSAPELVAKDEDLQKAIDKVETWEFKRGAEDAVHSGGPPLKLSRK